MTRGSLGWFGTGPHSAIRIYVLSWLGTIGLVADGSGVVNINGSL